MAFSIQHNSCIQTSFHIRIQHNFLVQDWCVPRFNFCYIFLPAAWCMLKDEVYLGLQKNMITRNDKWALLMSKNVWNLPEKFCKRFENIFASLKIPQMFLPEQEYPDSFQQQWYWNHNRQTVDNMTEGGIGKLTLNFLVLNCTDFSATYN